MEREGREKGEKELSPLTLECPSSNQDTQVPLHQQFVNAATSSSQKWQTLGTR